MIEFEIDGQEFKLREFIPYTKMGDINLYGMISIATKQSRLLKPYENKNPKLEGETDGEYRLRITELLSEDDKDKLQEIMFSYITVMQPMIQSLLITPKLSDISIGMGIKLQNHPKMAELIKSIMDDMQKGMGVDETEISKKA